MAKRSSFWVLGFGFTSSVVPTPRGLLPWTARLYMVLGAPPAHPPGTALPKCPSRTLKALLKTDQFDQLTLVILGMMLIGFPLHIYALFESTLFSMRKRALVFISFLNAPACIRFHLFHSDIMKGNI